MSASPSSVASILLVQRLVDTGAKPLSASEYWRLLDQVADPATLLGRSADDLEGDLDGAVESERIAQLLDSGTALAFERERLETTGIGVLTPFDEAWPGRLQDRLGSTAPPILFVAGPVELLADDGLGIVGSRNVDEDGAEVARSAARCAVTNGLAVVSGGARGVDQLSMAAALDAGGASVGVLADSLEKALRSAETRQAVLDGSACLVTPYKPSAGFTAANAMGRNKIVYALGRFTLVVATDRDKGGTWSGATEALRRGFGHVGVWIGAGQGPGNEALVEQGAAPVRSLEGLADHLAADVVPEATAPKAVQQTLL